VWNKTQIAAFQRGLATAEKLAPSVAKLEQLAAHMPQFADRIRTLALRLENAKTIATIALTTDAQG